MIPLHDENPTRITPYVTWAILALNVAVYLLQSVGGGMYEAQMSLGGWMAGWTLVPFELTQGRDVPTNGPSLQPFWMTIFSSMFMHGGLAHIFGNMVFLVVFGNNIEDALGHARFLFFYLVCGVLAALAQVFYNPGSIIPTLGASGAIAGVLGAYLLLFPRAMVRTLVVFGLITVVRIPALLLLGFWIVSQFFSQITGSLSGGEGRETGGVAYLAHIGGFLAGMALIKLFGPHPTAQEPDYDRYAPRRGGGFRY